MLRAKLPNAQYIFSFFLPECQNVFLHLETRKKIFILKKLDAA
jgi:hypothetical protein